MNKIYVFGYGSLMNLQSLSNALKKPITPSDVAQVNLKDFQRTWSVKEKVFFEDLEEVKDARFLDLTPELGVSVNGLIFEVSSAEYSNLVSREKNYDMVDVSKSIHPPQQGSVFTSISKPEYRVTQKDSAVIPLRYVEMIECACKSISSDFFDSYLESTEAYSKYESVEGVYKFIDPVQAKYI